MQPGPLVGIAVALLAILLGNTLEGGHIGSIIGGPAALIVVGGTIGAVLVQYPFGTIATGLRLAGQTFKKPSVDAAKVIDEICEYANRARREGILGLEKDAPNASHPFLAKALLMAVDGSDSGTIRSVLEVAISLEEEHGEDGAKAFEAAGGYAPTVGIIGAVLGLIHVMSNLSDIGAVGSGIAAAFVATIYGVAVANILFLPLGGRIKMRVKEEVKLKELMLEGVLGIQEGQNPKLVRARLAEYVHGPKPAEAAGGTPARAPA